VRTNSLGIRAEREFAFERPHGTSRVVIVGNSFMWGEGVANEHTFASRLDDLLPATEVINLGVHGYGTDQQLLRLRELGLRFAPNLVILGFYEENLWRNALSFRDYAKSRFRWVNGAFVLDNQPVPTPEAILAKEQRLPRSYLLVLARRAVRKTWWSWGGLAGSEQWRVTRAILELTRREVEAERARLLLLYIPAPGQDRRGLAEHQLAEWAAEQGVALLNLREQFAALAHEDRSRVYNGHWTPFGNQVAAELVAAFVASHGLALHGARTSPAR
jgi:hypothetical protein